MAPRAGRGPVTTEISWSDDKAMYVRGHDLCDLMGNVTFTQMIFLDIFGRMPTHAETVILDVVLVKAVEHGISPSAIAARMAYSCAPDSVQGAIAAGISTVGSVLLGTVENCARVLKDVASAEDPVATAREIAMRFQAEKKNIPGFGHPHFKPTDPRSERFFAIARSVGVDGKHMSASDILHQQVIEVFGKHLTKNASCATAAVLLDIDMPIELMRGFNVIGRSAGMLAHIYEERRSPAFISIMNAANQAVPYVGPDRLDRDETSKKGE